MRRQLSEFEDVDHPSVEELCAAGCGNVLFPEELERGTCRTCYAAALDAAREQDEPEDAPRGDAYDPDLVDSHVKGSDAYVLEKDR